MSKAAAECDVAVLGGGHGATAEMLLAGKPVLEVPIALEQRLTAEAVVRMGAGVHAAAEEPQAVREGLEQLLDNNRLADAARRFAARYAAFEPARQRRNMLARAKELVGD